MHITKIHYLYLCMLVSVTSCHATEIIFRFLDIAGLYTIKIEPVINANPDNDTYTPLSKTEKEYMQGYGQFLQLIDLPEEAEYLRISVRKFEQADSNKPGKYEGGGYCFFDASYLRERAELYKNSEKYRLGISIFNQLNPCINGTIEIEADHLH